MGQAIQFKKRQLVNQQRMHLQLYTYRELLY